MTVNKRDIFAELIEGFEALAVKREKMDSRQMLELAAKAAGIRLEWDGNPEEWQPMYYQGKTYHFFDTLEDDGDTLRLAVDCGIGMCFHDGWGEVFHPAVGCLEFKYGDDKRKATRYAITQLAAEIGKGMK